MKIWDGMEPHKTLFETSLVRLCILIPTLFALGTAIIILLDPSTDSRIGLTNFEGIREIYRSLTIPFLILSLAIPLTALMAGHHRSLQSRHQIWIQDQQNIFSNYVKHRELFIEFVDGNKPFPEKFKSPNQIYELVFPQSSEGIFTPSQNISPKLQREIETIYKNLKTLLQVAVEEKIFILNSPSIRDEIGALNEIYLRFSNEGLTNEETSFDDDGLTIVRSAVIHTGSALHGLYRCSNFLQSHFHNSPEFTLADEQNQILEELEQLAPMFYTLKSIKQAIKNHRQQMSENRLISSINRSLEDIHKNNGLYLMDTIELKNFLDEVLIEHLTDEEFSTISEHLPRAWKDAIHHYPEEEIP